MKQSCVLALKRYKMSMKGRRAAATPTVPYLLAPLPTIPMADNEAEQVEAVAVAVASRSSITPPLLSPRSVLSSASSSSDSKLTEPESSDKQLPARSAGNSVERNGKLYSSKKANKPYLKAHTWKEVEARRRARTKQTSPPVAQRTEQVSRSMLRVAVVMVLGTLLLSRMITETWTFGYSSRWTNIKNWIPRTVYSTAVALDDAESVSLPVLIDSLPLADAHFLGSRASHVRWFRSVKANLPRPRWLRLRRVVQSPYVRQGEGHTAQGRVRDV